MTNDVSGSPPAILLGGGSVALAVARALGRHGIPVTALGASAEPARWSRHCADFVEIPAGEGVERRWAQWLLANPQRGAVIMPCCDEALGMVARERQTFVDVGYRVMESNDEIVLAMLDKHATYVLARSVGVPSPRTFLAVAGETVEIPAEFGFPCAIKPRFSHELRQRARGGVKAFMATDRRELHEHLRRTSALGLDMLVTEVIPGPDDAFYSYYGYLDERGEPLLELTKRKLRQYPIGFGLATYHVIEDNDEVRRLGRRLFQATGLRGLACVEFKRDERDGVLKLIEVNHRFTLGTAIVTRAGVDLALVAYNRAVGRPVPEFGPPAVGLRQWHPVQDVRALLAYRRAGQLGVGEWGRSLLHRQTFPVFAADDPRPAAAKVIIAAAELARRSRHRGAFGADRVGVSAPR